MNILYVSSEAVPYSKTGGLADVAGTLPQKLAEKHTVVLAVPWYGESASLPDGAEPLDTGDVKIGDRRYRGEVHTLDTDTGLRVLFFSQDLFFARKYIYGDAGGEYPDNFHRYLWFQEMVMQLIIRWKPRFQIIHLNDWQTALLPLLWLYRGPKRKNRPAFVLTIHNIGYQGLFDSHLFRMLRVPPRLFSPDYLEFYGKLNCLKGGIVFADAVTTVSPTYAEEIQTEACGAGLDGLIRHHRHKLTGILNGADYSIWNPDTDPHIHKTYSSDHPEAKRPNKRALLKECGGAFASDRPLGIAITRLSAQKGIDLVIRTMEKWRNPPFDLMVLGKGDRRYEEDLHRLAAANGALHFSNGFDEGLAHRMQAAGDFLLMPSRYEPCGLTQMYALKYGTVPVVRATGGLDDTVVSFDPRTGRGNGFKFRPPRPASLRGALEKALSRYRSPREWRTIQANGMAADFSWDTSAAEYIKIYKKSLRRRH